MKQCSRCKELKDEINFNKDKKSIDKLSYFCKNCNSLIAKQWKKNNPDKLKASKRKYSLNEQNAKLKKEFGITLEQYNQMLLEQNDCCAICNKPESVLDHRSKQPRKLAVDHDKNTGKIRGLLCVRHNLGIGMFEDDLQILQKAIDYLNKSG